MTDPAASDVVVSDRLFLPLLTASRLERMLNGDMASVEAEVGARLPAWWIEERDWLLRTRLRQIQGDPASEPWLLRPIAVRTAQPEAIGLINFHGPPDDRGFAEVGYELRPEFRGQGYAIEAVRALFDWAAADRDVRRFRAGIAPGNERSINLVTKLGMRRVGAQWDEDDGLELLYTVEQWGRV
ncbi:MAG TPA: GNAT family N-acetyltransferase [Candidatus Limnocylindria bacterium]|nr:GNAT family N-acetyltransferase [Candidatus Limnocylindria bacterium]